MQLSAVAAVASTPCRCSCAQDVVLVLCDRTRNQLFGMRVLLLAPPSASNAAAKRSSRVCLDESAMTHLSVATISSSLGHPDWVVCSSASKHLHPHKVVCSSASKHLHPHKGTAIRHFLVPT